MANWVKEWLRKMSLCTWCLRWLPAELPVTSWNMQVRPSAIWLWKDVLLFVICPLKWEHVVVWLLRMKWLSNISKDVRMLRRGKHGIRLWNTGKRWRAMMTPYSIRRSVLMQRISSRWLRTEPIRAWEWELRKTFLLRKEWERLHRFLSKNRWNIWDSSRVNRYWVKRLITYSWALVPMAVLRTSAHSLL